MQKITENNFDEPIELKTTEGEQKIVNLQLDYTESGYAIKLNSEGSYNLKIGYYKYIYDQKNVTKDIKLKFYITKTIKLDENNDHYFIHLPLYGGYRGNQDKCIYIKSFD